MKFSEIVDQASALIERKGRVSYRALQREYALDDSALDDLKDELLYAYPHVEDDNGRGLLWTEGGNAPAPAANPRPQPPVQSPASYTPSHLAERILAEQAAMEKRAARKGERKTITALFADLKGSTAMIESLDPEDARAIIDPALQIMMDAVHRYDGYVAQALGDGIFALFGAPIAHEDHAQRALYAALLMQKEMRAYSDRLRLSGGAPLEIRIGANSGEVVLRSIRKDDLHTDYVPVGHSTNLAARMEAMATGGSILITEHTRKLTEGFFDLKALGKAEVRGAEAPIDVYEVRGLGALRTKLQVSELRGLSRFVGRHSEMDQLRQAMAHVADGSGQIVGVMGEPGLGKSRLYHEFKLASQTGCLILEAFSVSHGKATPYLPVVELLKDYFQLRAQDDQRTRQEKIAGKVLILDRRLEDTLPFFFALLGVDTQTSGLDQMDASLRRQKTFDALRRLFLRESLQQPLIVIFEDLHWIDSETQGFLDTLGDSIASARILLLVNYRPEYRHEWGGKTYYTQLRLTPLGREEAGELLSFLLGDDPSLTKIKAFILDRTDGTPFFIEEVVETLVEQGVLLGERGHYRAKQPFDQIAVHISPTVQGVLAARIDRLEPGEKALLQQLAVIGRRFPVGLVKQVVEWSEDELFRMLSSLQAKEYLYEQPAFPEAEYVFKHALTQEVTYGTVLQEQRKTLHEKTGHALEALYQGALEDHCSALAHHFQNSENSTKAVEYLGLAARQALRRCANSEAVACVTSALELLEAMPDSADRKRTELSLQLTLGAALGLLHGVGTPAVGRVYERAQLLAREVGSAQELFLVLWASFYGALFRAEVTKARELAEQCLILAERENDTLLLVEAHYALGVASLVSGAFDDAVYHSEQSIARYDPALHHAPSLMYAGQDPGVYCRFNLGWIEVIRGRPDSGIARLREAIELAREIAHPPSLAVALAVTSWNYLLRGEFGQAQEAAEAAIVLGTEQGLPVAIGWATVPLGSALVLQGEIKQGLAKIHEGIAVNKNAASGTMRSYFLGLLAEAQWHAGEFAEGLATVNDALATIEHTGSDRQYEPELFRWKGLLILQPEPGSADNTMQEAESCFHQAIATARRMGAKTFELRAATSLAQLWVQQKKQAEAKELLAPIYNWFTEGFATHDLREAKALLETLP